METIQHIILPLIIIFILLYIVWNLLRKLEKLEDNVEEQDEVLDSVETSVRKALDRMKEVDRIGSFEAEVLFACDWGRVFRNWDVLILDVICTTVLD